MRSIIVALSVVLIIAAISGAKADWMFISEAEIAVEWQGGSLETDEEFVKQNILISPCPSILKKLRTQNLLPS